MSFNYMNSIFPFVFKISTNSIYNFRLKKVSLKK